MRLYDLRHTAATLRLVNGEHPKVVQEMLGHASITLTLDTYSHVLPGMQEESAAAAGPAAERLLGSFAAPLRSREVSPLLHPRGLRCVVSLAPIKRGPVGLEWSSLAA